jgi:AcrR family transcriptional regulator
LPTTARRDVRWVGLSADERRAERRALLVAAAFELLGTEGWAGTTVRAVCQEAELNPRYFYESFSDLDALVIAVYEHVVAELWAAVVAAQEAAPDDRAAQARATIEAIVAFVDDDRRRARVLYVEALGNEALNLRRIEAGKTLAAAVAAHGRARAREWPEGEHIDLVAASMLVGGMSEVLVTWLDGRIDAQRDQLVDDLVDVALAISEASAAIAKRRAATRK